MLSSFTSRPVRSGIAMTGEITLRGNVLGVGGIKEKALAARRSGIRTVLLPNANRRTVEEIPAPLRRDLAFVFVRHVQEVFDAVLLEPDPPSSLRGRAALRRESLLQPTP